MPTGKKIDKTMNFEKQFDKKCNGTTHSCCNTRLKAEGGNARCCSCVPHSGCDFDKTSDWEERIDGILRENQFIKKDIYGEYSDYYLEDLKRFIKSEISEAREEERKNILKAIKEEYWCKSDECPDCKKLFKILESLKGEK